MSSRYLAGQFIVRHGADHSTCKRGHTYVVSDHDREGVMIRTLEGVLLKPRFAAERFRLATVEEIERARDIMVPIDPAFRRDGLTREQVAVLVATLKTPIVQLPTPSVRYAFRKNPPVRKPTVHPLPTGWRYSAEKGDGVEFDVIVRTRPAGWMPF